VEIPLKGGNMAERKKITIKLIKDMLANGNYTEIVDTEIKGFKVRLGKRTTTFIIRKKHNNKDIEIVLGHYPEMTIDEARKLALQKIASIEYYGKPDISPKKIPTVKDVLELQFSKIKFNYTNNTVLEKFRYIWDMQINSICKADVEKFLETHKETPQMANYSVKMLSAGFNRMCNEIELDLRNPCKGVTLYPTKARTRFLTPNEAPKLLEALNVLRKQKRNSIQADCLFLMIYTGQRKTNVLQLNKKDIQDNVWTIQSEEQKTQRDIIVPLNEFAIEIVNKYINLHKDGYLFKRNGRVMKDIPGTFKRACRMADVENCTIHDLRRSLGSWMLNNGVPIAVVSRTLGHSSIRVTEQVYAHLLGSTVSNATNQAINSMLKGEFEK
jgi:integrase